MPHRRTEKKNKLNIRDARSEDRDAARKITLSAFQQYAAVMPPPRWEGYRENILATLTDVAPAQQIVAEKEGAILWSVLLYPPGTAFSTPHEGPLTCPEVRLLAVAPEARGQGIGTALMKECIRRARRLGAVCLNLHTTDMMQVAMRMYERMGFVRAPELDFHPDPSITVKAYRLELDCAGGRRSSLCSVKLDANNSEGTTCLWKRNWGEGYLVCIS
jgi:GNAT superfamily N-acetyltransferase